MLSVRLEANRITSSVCTKLHSVDVLLKASHYLSAKDAQAGMLTVLQSRTQAA